VKIAVIIRPFGDESPHRNTIIPDLIWLKLRETSSRIDGGFKGQNYLEMLRGVSKGGNHPKPKKGHKNGCKSSHIMVISWCHNGVMMVIPLRYN
jgi:hypothetical protein